LLPAAPRKKLRVVLSLGRKTLRRIALVAPVALSGLVLLLHGPLADNPAYHRFADQSELAGIPHAGDVLSNAAFLLAGGAGLILLAMHRSRQAFGDPRERLPYALFFLGILLTAFGSTWYHLAPDSSRLFWDRLPMSLAFMALLAAVLADRVSAALAQRWLWPLLAAGAGSVVYWRLTQVAGREDLRPYALVQYATILAIALILVLYPARHTHAGLLWAAAGGYVLAKVFELTDRPVLDATGVVSGHTLKHIAAGLATGLVVWMIARRRPLAPAATGLS
jgi:hypothetical protein